MPAVDRYPHPSHVTSSGRYYVTGLDRTPAKPRHDARCVVCWPDPEPGDPDALTCDHCDQTENAADLTPDWNGETGCHLSCEARVPAPGAPCGRCGHPYASHDVSDGPGPCWDGPCPCDLFARPVEESLPAEELPR